jgi:hypothetical protein
VRAAPIPVSQAARTMFGTIRRLLQLLPLKLQREVAAHRDDFDRK